MKRIIKSPFFISLVIVVLLAITVSSISTYISIRMDEKEAASQAAADDAAAALDARAESTKHAEAAPTFMTETVVAPATGSVLGPVLEEYMASDDWLAFVEKYWDRAQTGEVEPMVRVYDAFNTCDVFKKEIQASNTKEELEAKLRVTRTLTDVSVGVTVFVRCKPLVDVMDEYPGWDQLLFQAALAGHPQSKARVVVDYYYHRDTFDREEVPFSPAEYLIEAMESHEPEVFVIVGSFGEHIGILENTSDSNTYGWKLLGCRFGLDCNSDKHFKTACAATPEDCEAAESIFDYYRNVIGDASYFAAEQRADELYMLVMDGRWDELGINYVW